MKRRRNLITALAHAIALTYRPDYARLCLDMDLFMLHVQEGAA